MTMLKRSIAAYPANSFAVHALADVQLKSAKEMEYYDEKTRRLIDEAVQTLLTQDAQAGLVIDEYPIVTLALGHVSALLKHGDIEQANKSARRYFDRIQNVQKDNSATIIQATRDRLFRFIALGEWYVKPPENTGRHARRERQSKSPRL